MGGGYNVLTSEAQGNAPSLLLSAPSLGTLVSIIKLLLFHFAPEIDSVSRLRHHVLDSISFSPDSAYLPR